MFGPVVLSILYVFNTLIDVYLFVVILAVVADWLIAFGVLSLHNQLARSLVNLLSSLTEPVFRQVRKIVPAIGGFDLSPIIVFIVLKVLQIVVNGYALMLV
ncbi:MAG: YggT family protein [Alphaproteobacteria bacterium]|nr:YggT family protein [Alphaproteobacteria bacterium]